MNQSFVLETQKRERTNTNSSFLPSKVKNSSIVDPGGLTRRHSVSFVVAPESSFQFRVINPKNNWHYVYLLKTQNPKEAINKKNTLRYLEIFKEAWVFKINL